MRNHRVGPIALTSLCAVAMLGVIAAPGGATVPANGGGKVIFEEDFSKGELGRGDWTTSSCCFDDDFWSYEISDSDGMVFQINATAEEAGSSPDATSPFKLEKKWKKKLTDQFVEVEVSLVGPAYPILICRNPGGISSVAGYGFIIHDDGTARIGKADGTTATILEATEPGAFDAEGLSDRFVTLGGGCVTNENGDVELTLTVDGEEILTATDPAGADPILEGIVALSAAEVGTVVFDNVKVYKL